MLVNEIAYCFCKGEQRVQWTDTKIFHYHSRKNWRRKFEKMNVIIHIVKLGRNKILSPFQSKVEN